MSTPPSPDVPIIGNPALAPVYAIRTPADLEYVASLAKPMLPIPLGQFLVKRGVVSADELKEALAMQRSNEERQIGWIVKALGHLDDDGLARILATHRGIPCVCLNYYRAAADFRNHLPAVATLERGVVILHENESHVWVATADATNSRLVKAVGTVIGKPIERVMAPHKEILEFFKSDWRHGQDQRASAEDRAEARRRFLIESGLPADAPTKRGLAD